MNTRLIEILVFITFILMTNSCVDKKSNINKTFPFSEKDMIENYGMIGALLEYAIYDSTKIEFVKKNICDSISSKNDFIFSKIETLINDNDSSFYFYHYHQREFIIFDYYGVIYLEINNPDSFFVYSYEYKYHTDEFCDVVDEISRHNNESTLKTIKHYKIGNYYRPNIFFIVNFNSMECSTGFIENVIKIEKRIKELFDSLLKEKFPNENILISPYIELRINNGY